MLQVPKEYSWLVASLNENAGHPCLVQEALSHYGVHEVVNKGVIYGWIDELKATDPIIRKYMDGSFGDPHKDPWCGLFMAYVSMKCLKPYPKQFLWALNWQQFGIKIPNQAARLGDILVFQRFNAAHKFIGGHVGLYIGEDTTTYFVLGGNESDQVEVTRVPKSRLFCVRSPTYHVTPANVKSYHLASSGVISTNEA